MSLLINRDGRPDWAKSSFAKVREAEIEERNSFIVEQAVREADTGYVHLGEISPQRDKDGNLSVMVTEDHLKTDVKDARARRSENKPVIPTFYFEDEYGEVHYFLQHDDALMGQAGKLCFDVEFGTGCLSWQKDSDTQTCDPISGPACGRRRNRT